MDAATATPPSKGGVARGGGVTDFRQEECQKELFQEFSDEAKKTERFPALSKTQKPILISASLEQLIFWGILAILLLCFMFFLGVLRSKSLGGSPVAAERSGGAVVHVQVPAPLKMTAPTASAKPADSPRAIDPAKPYTIVLVTYKKRTLAEKEAAGLKKSGQPAFVAASGDYFVVCIGQYANGGEAKKDLKIFDAKYKGCFLKRR